MQLFNGDCLEIMKDISNNCNKYILSMIDAKNTEKKELNNNWSEENELAVDSYHQRIAGKCVCFVRPSCLTVASTTSTKKVWLSIFL